MAQQVRDVVCGMQVDPDTASASTTYGGKTYYFCCGGCKTTFEKNPKDYLSSGEPKAQHQHH